MLLMNLFLPDIGPDSGLIASILVFIGPVGMVAFGSGRGGIEELVPED
jgi:hypothetical protein